MFKGVVIGLSALAPIYLINSKGENDFNLNPKLFGAFLIAFSASQNISATVVALIIAYIVSGKRSIEDAFTPRLPQADDDDDGVTT